MVFCERLMVNMNLDGRNKSKRTLFRFKKLGHVVHSKNVVERRFDVAIRYLQFCIQVEMWLI